MQEEKANASTFFYSSKSGRHLAQDRPLNNSVLLEGEMVATILCCDIGELAQYTRPSEEQGGKAIEVEGKQIIIDERIAAVLEHLTDPEKVSDLQLARGAAERGLAQGAPDDAVRKALEGVKQSLDNYFDHYFKPSSVMP